VDVRRRWREVIASTSAVSRQLDGDRASHGRGRAAGASRRRRLITPRSRRADTAADTAAAEERQQRRAGATKLDIDNAVEDEVDGKVDKQEKVGDGDRWSVGDVASHRRLFRRDHVMAHQTKHLRRSNE